jgi:DNA-binding NtrC family response regulator
VFEVGKKILLIDEKLDTSLYIALRHEGHDVIACESSKRAWNLVYPFRPHFIVVHLPQPSRNDIAILQECRAMARGVPIIVATSQPKQEGIIEMLEDRVTSFLSLPVKPDAVRKLLDDLEPPANEK